MQAASARRLAAACALGAGALALATPLLGGALRPGYSHCAQYISELGEIGAPHAAWVNRLGFLPIGLLVLLFCALAARGLTATRERIGLLCLSGVGWSYLVAAFFACDPGCPADGPLRQQLHNAAGVLEYVGGGAGILLLRGGSPLSWLCAAGTWLGLAGMLTPDLADWRGLFQRVAELSLFGWLAAVGARLRR